MRYLRILILLTPALAAPASATELGKIARGKHGMAATSSPQATEAAVRILAQGGNAVDAAVAACFALTVTDPPMTSIGGRSQIVIALSDGGLIGIDGATQAPAGVPALRDTKDDRAGYKIVPVPGNPAALAHAVQNYGRLPLAEVMKPAIEYAEKGFTVGPRLGEMWEAERKRLLANPGAAKNFLKADGSAYAFGDVFRQPKLAKVLRAIAESGPKAFYEGPIADAIARDVAAGGGYVTGADLSAYRPEAGTLVKTAYRGSSIVSMGRHGWGNTLGEMLNILRHFEIGRGEPSPREFEILARIIRQALDDRPQQIGTLRPKPDGHPLELLSSEKFGLQRANEIRAALGRPVSHGGALPKQDHDTTHLSVMDSYGNAVSMTTSIGPRFGSAVATEELGFLYAHSYAMRSSPKPLARDLTEMTPTIVIQQGKPVLAVGAAGSERIPVAIFQVISNVLDRGWPLEKALAAPRVFAIGNKVRIHEDAPSEAIAHLRSLGFELELRDRSIARHLGIAQAVQFDTKSGMFTGGADPVADGAAGGPTSTRSR
jgi:gamma-glutamyltranspeptidase/glutathione hydrolase